MGSILLDVVELLLEFIIFVAVIGVLDWRRSWGLSSDAQNRLSNAEFDPLHLIFAQQYPVASVDQHRGEK